MDWSILLTPAQSGVVVKSLPIAVALVASYCLPVQAVENTLDIYFIDVEGGQSTLIVTPKKETLLIDTGYASDGHSGVPGDPKQARDANRILAAVHDAHVERIDYLLITHFHRDHVGGVPELSQLIPIANFVDHASPSAEALKDPETKNAFDAYTKVRVTNRSRNPLPGQKLLLQGIDTTIVSSATVTIDKPLQGTATHGDCPPAGLEANDPYENPRSTGVVISYGEFRFLDVGDLTGPPLFRLACPKNMVGPVDVYLVAHHGGADAADPATFAAFAPRVAIMNNGMKKGGASQTYRLLHSVPSLEGVWQLHRSDAAGDQNFPDAQIANLDESTAHWIKLSAHKDGSFAVTNGRTGVVKTYQSRHHTRSADK
jgi:competence protein ComEC